MSKLGTWDAQGRIQEGGFVGRARKAETWEDTAVLQQDYPEDHCTRSPRFQLRVSPGGYGGGQELHISLRKEGFQQPLPGMGLFMGLWSPGLSAAERF